MMSSKDPGTLGFYGFRNRKDHSYDGHGVRHLREGPRRPPVGHPGRAGKHVVALGVPQTYPPREVNGEMVSCFLTPSIESRYTYPDALRDEIREVVGEYMVDVPDYRTDDRERVVRDINEMTRRRFKLARHLRDTRPWDFFMLVEMGPDRLHHCLWRFYDPNHPDYVPGTPLEQAFRDYYRYLDSEVGSLIEGLGDDTAVMVVSDHGAQAMYGRHPDQRVADAERLPGAGRPADRADADRPLRHRLAAHAGVGRRRLLLAHLPQREGPRAAGHGRGRPTTSRCATS